MYLGVDGGGTKTALCLLREDGRVAAQARAPSCYYFTEGIDLVGRVLRQGDRRGLRDGLGHAGGHSLRVFRASDLR